MDYHNYDVACTILETDTLNNRRQKLCLKFAQKDLKKDNTMFNKITHPNQTQQNRKKLVHEYNYLAVFFPGDAGTLSPGNTDF